MKGQWIPGLRVRDSTGLVAGCAEVGGGLQAAVGRVDDDSPGEQRQVLHGHREPQHGRGGDPPEGR